MQAIKDVFSSLLGGPNTTAAPGLVQVRTLRPFFLDGRVTKVGEVVSVTGTVAGDIIYSTRGEIVDTDQFSAIHDAVQAQNLANERASKRIR
ncbi:hypothetical protein LNV08_07790 [Paucibacter sp. TC2R-5]|uniref:hypothetical protein n=1 Tax=Paucibacter sp. TC2R-5 TaxID=2893555 RepID=UPI0021E38D12|nr:hypothetical protein [Paucibacter sp. TC2R-5]MCV2358881.1 hypothetical protein [Paucibacter sp. TC2R-5]